MTFKEDLKKSLDHAFAARKKKQAGRSAFLGEWDRIKREVIVPVLDRAVEVIEGYPTLRAKRTVNGSVILAIDGPETGMHHELTFKPNDNPSSHDDDMMCSSPFDKCGLPDDTLSFDDTYQARIEQRVEQFVLLIINPPSNEPFVIGG